MEDYLQITYLNDFVFCPYSIYLHQVFDNSSEEMYSAAPQQRGKLAHDSVDSPKVKSSTKVLQGVYVISNQLGVYGKIDTYYVNEKRLVERKYQIKTLYRGYYYQLWSQFFALKEMGYNVEQISFYSISERKHYPVAIPGDKEKVELREHIRKIARFDFEKPFNINPTKCSNCIYASLCDKTNSDHVYA